MALFRIERQLPPVTQDDIDAAAYRSMACLTRFKELRWVRSYYDAETHRFTCFYESPNVELIRRHAEMASIPCDAVTEVVEYLPEQYR
jgi:hypothetical protein